MPEIFTIKRKAQPQPHGRRQRDLIYTKGPGECRSWAGHIQKRSGYGTCGPELAHRVAYKEAKGEIPPGKELDHTCRHRPCIHEDHLEPVTHQENCRRGNVGKYPHKRKLTPEQRDAIKRSNATLAELARQFRISKTTARRAKIEADQ